MIHSKRNVWSSENGVAMIEFAFTLPIFLLLVFAVIEFGMYFVSDEQAGRAVASVALAAQLNPTDPSLQTLANSAAPELKLGTGGNYACAQSYATQAAAASGLCSSGTWTTGLPNGVAVGTPYYVAIKVYAVPDLVESYLSWARIPITQTSIVRVGATSGGGGGPTIPTCAAGQYLTSTDGSTLTCTAANVPSNAVGGGCTFGAGAGWSCWGGARIGGCAAGYTYYSLATPNDSLKNFSSLCVKN